jgi:molybdopterin/thiamine biosynthesis adenylyltransferase
MILTKEQINRYMRHIIMPEISGPGQKKLLESKVFIYGNTVRDTAPLVYYMSAIGIGHITCHFDCLDGYQTLFSNVQDLNKDIIIELGNTQSSAQSNKSCELSNLDFTFRIIFGDTNFFKNNHFKLMDIINKESFIPTVVCLTNQCKGILHVFDELEKISIFLLSLEGKYTGRIEAYDNNLSKSNESVFSTSFLGSLAAIEGTKICLDIGNVSADSLYFDLSTMEFDNIEIEKLNWYLEKFLDVNYDSIMENEKLSESKVLIVGTGGLGSPVAYALAMAGVGTIGLVDYDKVEISNLNRQIIHSTSRIGMSKVKSAEAFLKKLNPNININTYETILTPLNVLELISNYDLVVSAVDNFNARYALNDACISANKVLVEAGVIRLYGQNMTIYPGESACYRCIFPKIPEENMQTCSESGVLGAVPGAIGFLQAAEAAKALSGKGNTLKNKILFFDGEAFEFSMVNLDKNPDCIMCGKK